MYNICIPLRATDFKLTKVSHLTFYVWPVWVTCGQLLLQSLIQVSRISWFKETSQPSGRYLGNTYCHPFFSRNHYILFTITLIHHLTNANSSITQGYDCAFYLIIFYFVENHVGCSHPGLAWSGDTGYWSHAFV